jgi:hypothetical protein
MFTELQEALRQLQGASPAASSADAAALIQRLESRYGVRLPHDFRWYLTESSGFDGWQITQASAGILSKRIKSLPEGREANWLAQPRKLPRKLTVFGIRRLP